MANLYGTKYIGYAYDLLASLLWLPSKNKLYDQAVSLLGIQASETVLELGCGTGFLTKKLIEKKAVVTGVDQSAGMLARARERVYQAEFIQADILHYRSTKRFDYVLLFFVLHELNAAQRVSLLKSARAFLNENGRIIICDFATPERKFIKTIFPNLLRLWEPKSSTGFLKNGMGAEISSSDLEIHSNEKLHSGRVQLMGLKIA